MDFRKDRYLNQSQKRNVKILKKVKNGYSQNRKSFFFWALNAPKEYSAKFAIVFVQSTKFYQNWSNCSSVIASQTDR